MQNVSGRPRKTASSATIASPRVTSRTKLSQLQLWVNELAAMGFSTREIARCSFGSTSDSGRISHISNGHHMGPKPQTRPTEDDFVKIQRVYFIAVHMADKLTPLRDAALLFHGDMAKANSSAAEMLAVAQSIATKKRSGQ